MAYYTIEDNSSDNKGFIRLFFRIIVTNFFASEEFACLTMKCILFLAGLLAIVAADPIVHLSPEETEVARKALENPGLFQGDMAGIYSPEDIGDRSGIVGNNYRWPGARVPYIIDRSLSSQTNLIKQGMENFHRNTCVKFVERTNEQNYIKIFYGQGCYSMVGRHGNEQALSLGNGCLYVGTVVHELGHALGFFHEQSRSDRDNYLVLYLQNADQKYHGQFFKLEPNQNILYNNFDYNSIMIYGNKSFSKNGRDTMVAKNGQRLYDPFNKQGMTRADIERVNKMYNC